MQPVHLHRDRPLHGGGDRGGGGAGDRGFQKGGGAFEAEGLGKQLWLETPYEFLGATRQHRSDEVRLRVPPSRSRVPENGLRRQVREKDFTSGESSAEEGWEEHIYARIEEPRPALVEESGFFSHEEPREEILGSEEDEFVLVGGRAEPKHIQRLTVGGEERHVTRIQVQAFQPSFEEEKRRNLEAEREARRNAEERQRLRREQYEREERQQGIYEEMRPIQKDNGRSHKKELDIKEVDEEKDYPRQSVRDLRALYERVGSLH